MSIGHNIVTRAERQKHEQAVAEYLARGGKIKQIPIGVSGDEKSGLTLKEMIDLDRQKGRTAKQARGGRR